MGKIRLSNGMVFDNGMGPTTAIIRFPAGSNIGTLPMFYLLPKEFVEIKPKYMDMPRNLHQALKSTKHVETIADDAFVEFVWDCYAWTIWQYLRVPGKNGQYRSIPGHWNQYSGDFPLWRLSYGIFGQMVEKIKNEHGWSTRTISLMGKNLRVRWLNYSEFHAMICDFTNQIIEEQNWQPMIDEVWNNRQPEDYYGKSRNKYDFMRTWNHSRQSKPVSIEEMTESGAVIDGKITFDVEDPHGEFTDNVDYEVDIERFRQSLSEKDMKILQMRNDGYTMQEIADELGYKSASAVKKRIDKMCKSYEDFFENPFE